MPIGWDILTSIRADAEQDDARMVWLAMLRGEVIGWGNRATRETRKQDDDRMVKNGLRGAGGDFSVAVLFCAILVYHPSL